MHGHRCHFSRRTIVAALLGVWMTASQAVAAPTTSYDDLTADQLEQYARARQTQYTHEQALDYATQPVPKSLDDLSAEQRDIYDTMVDGGYLRPEDAFEYATDPPLPPYDPATAAKTGPEIDAETEANRAAAAEARRRASELRGAPAQPSVCDYNAPALLAELDRYRSAGDTGAFGQLWDSLPADIQRQISNLETARDASERDWLEESGLNGADWGVVWTTESAALLNTAAQADPNRVSLVQRGRDYYGPAIAELESKQAAIGSELSAANQLLATIEYNLDEMWNDDRRESYLEDKQSETIARIERLTGDYALVTEQLENTRRAAESYAGIAELADLKADETARTADQERRFQAAFEASQALRQQNAEIMTGQLAFRDARQDLQIRIDQARADGRDSAADQWQIDLGNLTLVEGQWLSMQTSIANGLQRELDGLLAQNASDGIGPATASQLANAIVAHGINPTLDPAQLQQVQDRIAMYAGGVQNNRAYQFGWRDALLTYSESFDDAVVAPWELVYDPLGSIQGNLRFWSQYGSFWYGVGRAAKDGIVDIVVLTKEILDTELELLQSGFNMTWGAALGTSIDWFGNENLQFIGNLANLTPDQIAEIGSQIAGQIERRIEMNAGSGDVNRMLEDTGYVVGTIAGAEEGVIRAVVITTRYGKVLVKGQKVEELLESAAAAQRASDARLASLSDEVAALPSDSMADPFSAAGRSGAPDIPPTNRVDIPATIDPAHPPTGPPIDGPGLINPRSGNVRIHGTGEGNRTQNLIVRFGPYKVELGPQQWLGGGSTSWAYRSPNDPNLVIKITSARGDAGLVFDNYGYRLLENAAQNGAIDATKLEFPRVREQIPIEGGGVVTIAELGPKTAQELRLLNHGQLSEGMVKAIQDGLEEMARNRMVMADFKLDNFGLVDLGNGQFRMSILDQGSIFLVDSPATARSMFSDLLAPPADVLRAIESIPASRYMDEVGRRGAELGATAADVGKARVLVANALREAPSFFDRAFFDTTTAAGKLADDAFKWLRVNEFKSWLGTKYNPHLDLTHLNDGTGLTITGLGPGQGLVYNPAAARQSRELREAFGAAASESGGFELIGSSQSSLPMDPMRLASGISNPSSPSINWLAGWNKPVDVAPSARLGTSSPVANFIVHMPYRWSDDALNDIALKPYIGRRFVIGATRLRRYGCETPTVLELNVPTAQEQRVRDQVAMLPGVWRLEMNSKRSEQKLVDDPLYSSAARWNQSAIRAVGLSEARLADVARETPVKSAVVAIIDTGVAWGHRDLNAKHMWINDAEIAGNGFDDDGNGYVDDVVGWNFIDQNNLPWDTDGHGTMVAGVVAAETANGVGIAGINPHARIMALRALDGRGEGRASHVAEAIVYAANNGADVVNLSLGGRDLTLAEILAVRYAQQRGVLLIAAAGNEAIDLGGWGPSGAPGMLVVGATDEEKRRMPISNWGRRLDLMAPGTDVVSLRSPGTDLMAKFSDTPPLQNVVGGDRAYYRASGTSFAAPIVTGVASLLLQRTPRLSPAEVRRILLNSTGDIDQPGWDTATGHGILDAAAALDADPAFFIDAMIYGVRVATSASGPALEVLGVADAQHLEIASLQLGRGSAPDSWQNVASLDSPDRDGSLASIPAQAFAGAPQWTLRLVVSHQNGRSREARFVVNLN